MDRHDHLKTERLILRRWRADHVEPFAALNADPEVMRYFVSQPDHVATAAMITSWEHKFEVQGYGLWAVERKADHLLLGMTGLNPVPEGIGVGLVVDGIEVGWRFARHAWGNGYATEAANAALDTAARVGLTEVWSFTATLNDRSQAVMRRLGMTRVSTFDHPGIVAGHPLRPHVLYRLDLGDRLAA